MLGGLLRLEIDSELRCSRTGLEGRVWNEVRGAMDGCDVGLELREESLGEVCFECVVLELVYLLVVELLGVDCGVWVDGVVLSEADKGEVRLEALDPVVERGDGDLGLVLALYGGLGLL